MQIAAAVALLAAAVPLAAAAESSPSRAEYRTAVEPICQTNTQANERILKGVRTLVQHGKLKQAAARFAKAATALKKALAELEAAPKPAGDEARLTEWLKDVRTEASLFEGVGAKLRANNKRAAQQLVSRLSSNANAANGLVVGFEFKYCKLNPSRFT